MYRSKKNSPPKRSGSGSDRKGSQRKANPPPAAASKVEEVAPDAATTESQLPTVADVSRLTQETMDVSQAQANSVIPSTTPPLRPESELRSIVEFKEKFTAPVVIYESESQRICANPSFDRAAVAQLSRIQGMVLHQLRQSHRDAAARTPKELLFDLERVLLGVVAASSAGPPAAGDVAPFVRLADPLEAAKVVPQIESVFAQRAASARSVAAVGYVLSEGISHDAFDDFLGLLTRRLAAETDPSVDSRRTPDERQALRGTANNVRDFTQLLSAIRVAYGGIYTNSQRQRLQPASLADGNGPSAKLLWEGYYKLLRGVLAVDEDRLGGSQGAPGAIPGLAESAMAGKQGEVWVTEYDPHTGRIALERRSPSQRWGLVFDGAGLLVGIENALRNGSEAGERLYYALQQSKGAAGMAVLQVNRRRIRTANLTAAELESKRREILGRLTDCLRGDGRTLQMVVEKRNHAELTAAREVFFEASQQGGERGVGQQVLLILERAAPTIPWGLKLAALPDTPPLLTNFSDKLQLSKKAKNFLFDHRGRLRVVSVNYRDTHRHFTTEQLKQYMSESLLLALWLQVADPPSEGIEGASFFGDGQSPREAAEDPASSLGAGEAYKAPTKAVDKGADKIRLGHEETTERSAGNVIDRDTNLVGDKKGLRGADALDPEVDDWTIEKDLLSEQEDDTPEDVQNGSPELDAELAEYDALEKELESLSAMEDLEEARGVPDEGLPDESDSAELQGAEAEETSPEADVSAAKLDSKKDKVTSKKDKKSKKTSKNKKKSSTNERKESSKRGEATTSEDENDAIDKDGISREEIDEAIEPSGVGNPKTLNDRNAAADTPLIEPKPTSAELAMRVAEEARHNASDSSKTRKSKSSKDPEALERGAAPGEDAPLVDSLKTSAEVALEAAGRGGVNGEMPAVTPSAPYDAATAENASVSITQLLATPPLRFDNEVIANKFDGKVLELSRPSTEVPWNIKMAFVGDEVLLSKLPSVGNERKDHPYLRYLGAMPAGNVRCAVESMNGVDLLVASKVEKAKLMDTVKKSTKLSMILKILR